MATRKIIPMAVGFALLLAAATEAALVSNVYFSTASETNYPAITNDLVNAGQPTFAGSSSIGYTEFEFGGGTSHVANLNDGSIGVPSAIPQALSSVAFDIDGIWTTTFALNTNLSPSGYTITNIAVKAGWPGPRASQKFTVLYTTVAGGEFIPLGTFTYIEAGAGSSMVELTDSSGTIAAGVAQIQFAFMSPLGGGETVVREVDVLGYPSTGIFVAQVRESSLASYTNYPVSATDLINAGRSTLASADHQNYTPFSFGGDGPTSAGNLNDGSPGLNGGNANTPPGVLASTAFDADGLWTSTYYLDTNRFAGGYVITSIATVAGWNDERIEQYYRVYVSALHDPSFVLLANVAYAGPTNGSSRVRLVSVPSGPLARGVDAVRFEVLNSLAAYPESVYREFDVFGYPIRRGTVIIIQ